MLPPYPHLFSIINHNEGLSPGSTAHVHFCSSMCICASVAAIYTSLFFFLCAWSNTSTFNDRSSIKPLSLRDESVKSTCLPPLPSVFCWITCSEPRSRHFFFLTGVLTPLLDPTGALGRRTMLFTAQRALWAERHGWLNKGATCCSLAHKHTSMIVHKQTQSHEHPRGLAEMFTSLQSLHTVGLRVMDVEMSHNPGN